MDEPQVTITVGFSLSLSSGLQRGQELINRPCTAQCWAGSEPLPQWGFWRMWGRAESGGPGQEGAGADFLGAAPVIRTVLVQG